MRRRTHEVHQVRQVLPAPPGWRAVFAEEVTEGSPSESYCLEPVIALGEVWSKAWLCDERGAHVDVEHDWQRDRWEALIFDCEFGELEHVSLHANFLGLVHPGEEPTNAPWIGEARDAYLARAVPRRERS